MSDFLDLQGAKDLNTDAIHIGAVANSKDPVTGAAIDTHTNRVGGTDYTLRGFWNALGPVVMPWTSVTGGTLTQPNQAFLHPANGNYYSWTGAFPHVVAPGTDPATSAGFSERSGEALRKNLSAQDGIKLIGLAQNISSLRGIEPSFDGQRIRVGCHTSRFIGGGEFEYDESDTATADDNGWTIVTSNGKRWKRICDRTVIYLDDFGAYAGGPAIDSALTNAWNTATANSVSKIVLPRATQSNPLTITGGLNLTTPLTCIELTGPGSGWFSTWINHTGNNTAITFPRPTSGLMLFVSVKISNMTIIGNSGSSANGFEFQDSWGNSIKSVWITDYQSGAAFTVHNKISWSEGFKTSNVMSRKNKAMVMFKRTSSSGGTGSFYGLTISDTWHQFGVGNSYMFDMITCTESMGLYASNIDVGGWFEAGGGHRVFMIGGTSTFTESNVNLRLDGFGGISNGSDLFAFCAGQNARIDVNAKICSQQSGDADLSSLSTGAESVTIRHIVEQGNPFFTNSAEPGRPVCRVKGAAWRMKILTTENKVIVIKNLPVFSTWKARLICKGSNTDFAEEYIITVNGQNVKANVTSLVSGGTATANNNVRLQVFSGLTDGTAGTAGYLTNGGCKIEWKVFAATAGGSEKCYLELEMM